MKRMLTFFAAAIGFSFLFSVQNLILPPEMGLKPNKKASARGRSPLMPLKEEALRL
jgi:hypothetical protein